MFKKFYIYLIINKLKINIILIKLIEYYIMLYLKILIVAIVIEYY